MAPRRPQCRATPESPSTTQRHDVNVVRLWDDKVTGSKFNRGERTSEISGMLVPTQVNLVLLIRVQIMVSKCSDLYRHAICMCGRLRSFLQTTLFGVGVRPRTRKNTKSRPISHLPSRTQSKSPFAHTSPTHTQTNDWRSLIDQCACMRPMECGAVNC